MKKINPQPGIYLKASELLIDTYFEGAIIFIAEYNVNGALGFVINNPYPKTFNDLVEFSHLPPFTLYEGGPVELEKLFYIHSYSSQIPDSVEIAKPIYWGGDFKKMTQLMEKGEVSENLFRLFIGYCGWDAGQLEAEIEEGSWVEYDEYRLFG